MITSGFSSACTKIVRLVRSRRSPNPQSGQSAAEGNTSPRPYPLTSSAYRSSLGTWFAVDACV